MALDNCSDCPNYCFGNEVFSDCVVYDGRSLKTFLDDLQTPDTPEPGTDDSLTTDSIMSKSVVRNTSSVCGAKIVTRSFQYTLTTSQTGSIFGWNLSDVVRALPPGYQASVIRVRVSGSTTNGKNVIGDSNKQSGGINIRTNQYPVTADILVRVTSPCGDIDMEKTLTLNSPSKTGTFTSSLKVVDLNPDSGEIILTDQLNALEAQVYDLNTSVDQMVDPTTMLEQQQAQIGDLSESVNNAGTLLVDYTDAGSKFTKELSIIITNLYAEINTLKATVTSQEVEISNLRAQIDSINATS